MSGLGKSADVLVAPAGRYRRTGMWAWGVAGMACVVGTALTFSAQWVVAGSAVPRWTAFGPSTGCWGLAVSLWLRAWGAGGRVRTRLLLLGGSAVAGGVYRATVDVLSAHPPGSGRDDRSLLGSVVLTGVTLAVGLGTAGLVTADAGEGRHVWVRRVLDGVVAVGAVFMTGWVLLRGASDGWRTGTGTVGVLWTAEVVFGGVLFALRRHVRSDQRATLSVGIVGLSLMVMGDTLRLWTAGPQTDGEMSRQLVDSCSTAGLLVVALSPWLPGGASVLSVAQPTLRWGMEGAAGFLPLTVCTVTVLGYVLAPPARDPVPLLVGGTALLSLWARRTFLPGGEDDDRRPSRMRPPHAAARSWDGRRRRSARAREGGV